MKIVVFLVLVVAASGCKKKLAGKQRRDAKKINDRDMTTLTTEYGLGNSHLGGFKVAQTWQSSKGNPEATAYLIVLNDGACGKWVHFTDKDRLFVWHKGKTYIDIIDEDGKLTTKCLGNTLDYPDCRYIVHIPANHFADIRVQPYVVLTGIAVNGTAAAGVTHDYNDMAADFADNEEISKIIRLTEDCYT